jgi:hypothetical protein
MWRIFSCEPVMESYAAQKVMSKDIKAFEKKKKEIRVLLLGTGDSGKTTVLKQLQILHGDGFEDRMPEFRHRAASFILRSMTYLVSLVDFEKSDDSAIDVSRTNLYFSDKNVLLSCQDACLDYILSSAILRLWEHPAIRRESDKLHHSVHYFIPRVRDFANPEYEITNQGCK